MGATVSVAKRAAAFKAHDGTIGYLLFEQSYSKNSYPHSRRWGCMAMGNRAEVLRAIFLCACSFEDGILQSGSGDKSTEDYIQSWLDALANPLAFPDVSIPLGFGTNFDAPICNTDIYGKDRRESVLTALLNAGFTEVADTMAAGGTIPVSLYGDFSLLRVLFAKQDGHLYELCPQWKVVSVADTGHRHEPTLAFPCAVLQKTPTIDIPELRCLKLQTMGIHELVARHPDGYFARDNFDWTYAQIRTTIADAEIAVPGSFRANLKALRAATRHAPPVDQATRVEFNLDWAPEEYKTWMEKDLAQAADMMGKPAKAFSTTVREILELDAKSGRSLLWSLLRLRCSRWYPPVAPGTTAALDFAGTAVEA